MLQGPRSGFEKSVASRSPYAESEPCPEIREDTFKVMWELSAPGGAAEGCFHRTTEYAFYYDGLGQYADDMPNVRRFGSAYINGHRLITAIFSSGGSRNPTFEAGRRQAIASLPT